MLVESFNLEQGKRRFIEESLKEPQGFCFICIWNKRRKTEKKKKRGPAYNI